MSWMSALIETYDNYFSGMANIKGNELPPIRFVEKQIDVKVYLNSDGTFNSASLTENNNTVIIPASPEAEGRIGDDKPYPLYDNICFVSGDLSQYTTDEKLKAQNIKYYTAYKSRLEQWKNAAHAPEELGILYSYIEKGTLISDLISSKTVPLDKNGEFPKKLVKNFVGFLIYSDAESQFVPIAGLPSVIKSWQTQLSSSMTNLSLSYASGVSEPILLNHAKVEGNAKLISAKDDKRDFQYKGRFRSMEEACMVGYESSAKIHNTVRWLIKRQGFTKFGIIFLSWNTECREIIQMDDDFAFCSSSSGNDAIINTSEDFAYELERTMRGLADAPEYKKGSHIVLLGMEAATPGRMSLNFFEELDGSDYLERLHYWYSECFFRLCRLDKNTSKPYLITTTPNLYEIGTAVFGEENMRTASRDARVDKSITKLVRRFYMDMFSCICGKRRIPDFYVQTAYHRILNPLSFTRNSKWSRVAWEQSVSVSLAMLYNRRNNKEEYQVSLNAKEKDRSYLFGRLTAIADVIENIAMDKDYDRQTNAVRYFTAMQQRPASTWQNLRSRLEPYFAKIRSPKLREFYRNKLDEVYSIAEDGALSDNKPLSPRFIEGYHNQRYELLPKKKEN